MGITGLKFVELSGGTDATPSVPPGGTIQSGRSFMGIIGGKAEDIAIKLELALNKINAIMGDDNIGNINDIILNVKNITANVNTLVDDSDNKISKIVDDLTKASADIGEGAASAKNGMARVESLIQSSSPGIEEVVVNLTQATSSFKKTAHDLQKINEIMAKLSGTITEFQSKLASVDVSGISNGVKSTVDEAQATLSSIRRIVDTSRENIFHSVNGLKRTLRNLEEFSAEIRDQPSLLLSNKKQDDRASPKD
jgi:phospholipid/cholesterol/gamma-HCH transport system substrate-binding protein